MTASGISGLKAVCIIVLYYSDGESIKFPIKHEIYYKDTDNMPWQQGKESVCISNMILPLRCWNGLWIVR